MSLLSVIGGIAKVGIGVATGGVAGGAIALGSVLAGGDGGGPTATPLPPTTPTIPGRRTVLGPTMPVSTFPVLKSRFAEDEGPSRLSLPSPDSVKVSGGGISIGPGGSIFKQEGPSATAYYGAPGMSGVQSGATSTAMTVCAVGTGMRLNKTGYHLRSGEYVPPGTRCVRARRRNSLNPRALSRAISRVAAAKKWSRMLEGVEVKRRRCR